MKAIFFKQPADFRAWLEAHHDSVQELWVGYYKKHSLEPSITWPESVDQALCYGWIDGVRKTIDDVSYAIRFTPRKPQSTWSAVNTRRAAQLIESGLMTPAGASAFQLRRENKSGIYAYENPPAELPEAYLRQFQRHPGAWEFFRSRPAGYRRTLTWWVLSAKREETRLKRLETLIQESGNGRTMR